MRLVISAAARADLKVIARYSRHKWSERQAKTYLGLVAARFALLRRRPRLGMPREDLAPGYRSLSVGRHLVFYRLEGAKVVIIRLLHQSMDARLHL
jgi:toxin ParE1/3/4